MLHICVSEPPLRRTANTLQNNENSIHNVVCEMVAIATLDHRDLGLIGLNYEENRNRLLLNWSRVCTQAWFNVPWSAEMHTA